MSLSGDCVEVLPANKESDDDVSADDSISHVMERLESERQKEVEEEDEKPLEDLPAEKEEEKPVEETKTVDEPKTEEVKPVEEVTNTEEVTKNEEEQNKPSEDVDEKPPVEEKLVEDKLETVKAPPSPFVSEAPKKRNTFSMYSSTSKAASSVVSSFQKPISKKVTIEEDN
jgi:hypothetical protein